MSEMCAPATFRVVKDHIRSYDVPISVSRGEVIRVGPRDPEWPDWLWCMNTRHLSGWVPAAVLDLREDGTAAVTRDYTSLELTVTSGEVVTGFEQLGGWLWCRNQHHEEGWIPLANVVAIP